MRILPELGQAVMARRKSLRLSQQEVSKRSGITRELLVRFERGQVSEFGSRKLMAVLAVLGLEINFGEVGMYGTLDELRRERGNARN
jgi:HTH-type transcriptional regulator / antitoxin HipB